MKDKIFDGVATALSILLILLCVFAAFVFIQWTAYAWPAGIITNRQAANGIIGAAFAIAVGAYQAKDLISSIKSKSRR